MSSQTTDSRHTCGYTVIDEDGDEQPCGRPVTGYRWYQNVEHEDTLNTACDLHENEGGNRMHAAEAERDDLRARLAKVEKALAGHPECDVHPDDDPITCGWKSAVVDVTAALASVPAPCASEPKWLAFPGKRPVCRDCGADWSPVRRGECVACGSDAGPISSDSEPAQDADREAGGE